MAVQVQLDTIFRENVAHFLDSLQVVERNLHAVVAEVEKHAIRRQQNMAILNFCFAPIQWQVTLLILKHLGLYLLAIFVGDLAVLQAQINLFLLPEVRLVLRAHICGVSEL